MLYLFALVLPQSLPFTVPMGVLVATLITLTRMSTDGEITAMRAAGYRDDASRRPSFYSASGLVIAATASLWLTPWTIRERYRVENQLIGNGLTADVQPRVFEEHFPNSILYVTDVTTGVTGRWKRIFLADVTPPEERQPGSQERGDSPVLRWPPRLSCWPTRRLNRLQLSLRNGSTYEAGKDSATIGSLRFRPAIRRWKPVNPAEVRATRALGRNGYAAALPLGLSQSRARPHGEAGRAHRIQSTAGLAVRLPAYGSGGIPLGITRRRAGKSAAVVMTAGLAFIYYIGLIGFIGMARQGSLTPEAAVWLPNLVFAIGGLAMLLRLEKPGDRI